MKTKTIPEHLKKLCESFFHNDCWFTIKHPALDYQSPWRILKDRDPNDPYPAISRVERVLRKDIADFS